MSSKCNIGSFLKYFDAFACRERTWLDVRKGFMRLVTYYSLFHYHCYSVDMLWARVSVEYNSDALSLDYNLYVLSTNLK